MLVPNDCTIDIGMVLITFDGFNEIVIQEGTYNFSHQSFDTKTSIAHGKPKLYF
jgi:hypothetical protein